MRSFDKTQIPKPEGDFSFLEGMNYPLVIEIGCGVGMHPFQFCEANKNEQLIAIERTKEKFRKFKVQADEKALGNLYPVHGDGIAFVSHFVKPEQVKKYFLLYPNPYPKKKQANQRFMNMPFMEYLKETLVSGGEVELATNMESYYQEAKEMFVEQWGLELVEDKILDAKFEPRTHFEKKYLERGELCYNLIFRKPK